MPSAFLPTWLLSPRTSVSPKGMVAAFPNNSSIPNDGAEFGPDTLAGGAAYQLGPPYSTTSGIAEAIASLPTGGGAVFLLPTQVFPVQTQIQVPSNVVLLSDMYGGQADGQVVSPPAAYIQPPAPPSTVLANVIIFPDSSSKNGFVGVGGM